MISTSWIAPLMKTASSPVTKIETSSGSVAVELGHRGAHAVRDVEGVRPRLADDADARRRSGRWCAARSRRCRGPWSRVATSPRRRVGRQHQRLEGRLGRHRGGGAHHEALVGAREGAGGGLEVGVVEHVAHLRPASGRGWRARPGRCRRGRSRCGRRRAARRRRRGPRSAGPRCRSSTSVRQLLDRARGRGDADAHHRLGVGVGLDDARVVDVLGQGVRRRARWRRGCRSPRRRDRRRRRTRA